MHRDRDELLEEPLTRSILGGFYTVYNGLGQGFREHVYAAALEDDLIRRGHRVSREVSVQIWWRGRPIARERLDMVIDDKVIVENKAGLRLREADGAQLIGYLAATKLEVGLLLHFGPAPTPIRLVFSNDRKQTRNVKRLQERIASQIRTRFPDPPPLPVDVSVPGAEEAFIPGAVKT